MDRLLDQAHALAREWWDPSRRLLIHPGGLLGDQWVEPGAVGLPLATAWWAYGLLRRARAGDRELAEVALGGVVAHHERGGSELDVHVGAALALVGRDHALPDPLGHDLRVVAGQVVRSGRTVAATRTVEAVHRAWLELEVGRTSDDAALLDSGAQLAREVAADSGIRGHVAEHIGPTSTGLTLLGLSLWAERPPVADLAPLGRALRDEVWHDLLAVWHPGLLTIIPPFSHAHGMDLRAHVGATAAWLAWLVDGVDPLPSLHGSPLHQAQDVAVMFPVAALAGASEDVRALAPLVRAQPARQGEWFDRVGERVWTGWTGPDLAVGAEFAPRGRDAVGSVPAAAVWRPDEDGRNAWLRLQQREGAVEARVEQAGPEVRLVHGTHAAPVELWIGGGAPEQVTAELLVHGGRTWSLSGAAALVPIACDVPEVTAAWEVVPDADGIVLRTRI